MKLRLLVMSVSDRCDQRCVHCQIWSAPARPQMSLAERSAVLDEALAQGTRDFLLTGGEPLLSPDLWPLAARARQAGATLRLASNGMLLERYAERVAGHFDEVYISLDGASAETHDRLRGVAAHDRVRAGIAALKRASARVRVVARSTLHAGNIAEVESIVAVARRMGFDEISFLALDARSSAFGGDPAARHPLVPDAARIEAFEAAITRLEAARQLDGFVTEPPAKLRRIAQHLRASAGLVPFERPECDAPEWSSVVEADGTLRPCFFHASVGDARDGLARLRSSSVYAEALAAISAPNATCAACVCPKKRVPGLVERLGIRAGLA